MEYEFPTDYPTKFPGDHYANAAYPTDYPTNIGELSHTTSPTAPSPKHVEHNINDFSLSPTFYPTVYPIEDLNVNEYPTLFPTTEDRLPGGTNFPTTMENIV
jgi:hypothetical protein